MSRSFPTGLVDYESSDDGDKDEDEDDRKGMKNVREDNTEETKPIPIASSSTTQVHCHSDDHISVLKPSTESTSKQTIETSPLEKAEQPTQNSDKNHDNSYARFKHKSPPRPKRYESDNEDQDEHDDDDRVDLNRPSVSNIARPEDKLKTIMEHGFNSRNKVLFALSASTEKNEQQEHTLLVGTTPQNYHDYLREKFGEKGFKLDESVNLVPTPSDDVYLTSMQSKIDEFYRLKGKIRLERNEDLNYFIQKDELGTNYPKEYYDPHGWSKEAYYDSSLYRHMDAKSNKRHRTPTLGKTEYIANPSNGSHVDTHSQSVVVAQKLSQYNPPMLRKKTKWDVGATSSSVQTTSSSSHRKSTAANHDN